MAVHGAVDAGSEIVNGQDVSLSIMAAGSRPSVTCVHTFRLNTELP